MVAAALQGLLFSSAAGSTTTVQNACVVPADFHLCKALPEMTKPSVSEIEQIVMAQVKETARERAKDLTADTNIIGLGLDSLERLDVVARVEAEFGIRIPEVVLIELETCKEIAGAIKEQLSDSEKNGESVVGEYYDFDKIPELVQFDKTLKMLADAGEGNPFFTVHESISNNLTRIGDREFINYSGNNYLGMSGDPDVTEAAKAALDLYGTSVSASRLVSGTRPIHTELEQEICQFIGCEDSITFTSGHSTNTTVIGHLMGAGDLIIHDDLVHNSIITGALLSGARRRPFPHNDWQALDDILGEVRHQYRKVLVIIEGVYSMDGDYANLPAFIEVKQRHQALLLVDEAHSIGTMGMTGRGMGEFFDVQPADVDIWMGTLSKAFGSSGGYVAGREPIIRYMKHTSPGVIFTLGLCPASSAAALTVFKKLRDNPEQVATLQARASYFLQLSRQHKFNTGDSQDTPIIPVILGNSLHAVRASRMMHERGISVQPIMHPAVNEAGARLRFFVNALHSDEQLETTVENLAVVLEEIDPKYVGKGVARS